MSTSEVTVLPVLLTPAATARLLGGINPGSLAVWRCTGTKSLPWIKVGRRVFYKQSDVLDFIERQRQKSPDKRG